MKFLSKFCIFLIFIMIKVKGLKSKIQLLSERNPTIVPHLYNLDNNNIPPISKCECAGQVRCPSCANIMNRNEKRQDCSCAPKLNCPPCPYVAKSIKFLHEIAASEVII